MIGQDSKASIFKEITTLNVGEHLLFLPTAMLDVFDGKIPKLGFDYVKCKTRMRITADGGRSVMAIDSSDSEDESSDED